MRNKTKWIIGGVLAFVLVLGVCHFVQEDKQEFNWSMYGARIQADGQVAEYLEFTAKGFMLNYDDKPSELEIEVLTPSDFPYSLPKGDYLHSDRSGIDDLPYFVGSTYAYNKVANDGTWSAFALDMEAEYAIFKWDDSYLVGSTDPDADLTAVFDHFKEFVNIYTVK